MTDIEICEQIVKVGDCSSTTCEVNIRLSAEYAKDYLKKRRTENKTMTKKEAILAILNGKEMTNIAYIKQAYVYWENGCFMAYSGITCKCDMNIEPDDGWYIYEKPAVKKWQWAYKSKDQLVHKPRGEVTKHLTEAVAKELYGNDIIKLPFTEITERDW